MLNVISGSIHWKKSDVLEADRQIKELYDRGLITETRDCSWNSPIFMVRKRDQSLRMVQDLRKSNSSLRPLILSLPRIDDLLREISLLKPNYITSSDFYKGYYGIQMASKTAHLTAFTNPRTGISYSWKNPSFWIFPVRRSIPVCHVTSFFQNREKFNFLFYYVDDLAIASRDNVGRF